MGRAWAGSGCWRHLLPTANALFFPLVHRRMVFQASSARAQRTSAWIWGPFRTVNISRTWASGPFPTASLGRAGTAAPPGKRSAKIRASPAQQRPRACRGDAAGKGHGAAQRAGRGQVTPHPKMLPPVTLPSRAGLPTASCIRGVCTVRGPTGHAPKTRTHAHTQSLCMHANLCAWAVCNCTPDGHTQTQSEDRVYSLQAHTITSVNACVHTPGVHGHTQPADLRTHSALTRVHKPKHVICTLLARMCTKPQMHL